MNKSIGALEFRSISRGIYVSDAIVKKANVEIIYYKTICPGKFLVIVAGDEGEVDEAITYGESIDDGSLVDRFRIHAVTPAIIDAFKGRYVPNDSMDAVGLIETFKVCSGIQALDQVLKAGDVKLVKIFLAFAIGGKLVFIVTGTVSSIEYSFSACKKYLSESEAKNMAIIPSPSKEILKNLFKNAH